MTKDIELDLKQEVLDYSVYVKDTQTNFHYIKTVDEPLKSNRIMRQQEDYVIEELFVRIENNSDEDRDADLDVRFIGKGGYCLKGFVRWLWERNLRMFWFLDLDV